MNPITPAQAEEQGLRPLAGPYSEAEAWMVKNVQSDMRRGGIAHAVVLAPGGAEVWRASSGWKGVSK